MRKLAFAHTEGVERFCAQVGDFVTAASSLGDLDLLDPSGCRGWSRLDVVVHVRMGLQEMAIVTLALEESDPDHDAASYWSSHPDDRDEDPVPHILWLRRTASAYARPSSAVRHLRDVADAAARTVRAMPDATVCFQGKRLLSGDFLATWVVELAVHQLDLQLSHDHPSGLDWVRATLEAVAGSRLPAELDDRSAVLMGLGRVPGPASTRLDPAFPVTL